MCGDGGVSAAFITSQMAGHTLAFVEAFHGGRREPYIQGPVHQGRRHTVGVALDLHVRIDIHPRDAPLGIDVGLERERLQRRPVYGLEDGPPTAGELFEGTGVQAVEASGERGVQFRQTEEGLMAQPGEDPALHEQHARFDLGLVPRFPHPSWDHRDPVVVRERSIGGIQLRFIPTVKYLVESWPPVWLTVTSYHQGGSHAIDHDEGTENIAHRHPTSSPHQQPTGDFALRGRIWVQRRRPALRLGS